MWWILCDVLCINWVRHDINFVCFQKKLTRIKKKTETKKATKKKHQSIFPDGTVVFNSLNTSTSFYIRSSWFCTKSSLSSKWIYLKVIDDNLILNFLQHYHQIQQHEPLTDISIWISEQQVRTLSGYSLRIFAIENGRVSQILRDPAFDSYLPMM